jgi:hypothetical protein
MTLLLQTWLLPRLVHAVDGLGCKMVLAVLANLDCCIA